MKEKTLLTERSNKFYLGEFWKPILEHKTKNGISKEIKRFLKVIELEIIDLIKILGLHKEFSHLLA